MFGILKVVNQELSQNNCFHFALFTVCASSDIRQAREKLLALLPDPNQDLGVLHAAAEAYFSLLLGFIEPTEGPKKADRKEEPPKPQAAEGEMLAEDDDGPSGGATLGANDSKLRNAVKVKWSNTLSLPPM